MDHPYKQVEGTATWQTIANAIAALVQNGDISELTDRDYIVGYITTEVEQQMAHSKKKQD